MRDFLGNEIQVGDRVVYALTNDETYFYNHGKRLKKGIVRGVEEDFVYVKTITPYLNIIGDMIISIDAITRNALPEEDESWHKCYYNTVRTED